MSKTLQGHRIYRIKQNKTKTKQKGQKRRQLYCAVGLQSRSLSHCQTTTEKAQSSARDGTSSATVHSWQTTAGCSTHVPKPLGRHGHRALNVRWTVPPAWLSAERRRRRVSTSDVYRGKMQFEFDVMDVVRELYSGRRGWYDPIKDGF